MNPETNLIVLCARTFLSNSEASVLRSALAEPLDWSVLESSAENHSVMPLVVYVLGQHGAGLVPQDSWKRLQDRLRCVARNNLAWVQEWLRVLQALAEAGIPVISFKGPALALMAYRNLALREFNDLDLLVQPCDVLKTRDALVRVGYVLGSVVPDDTDAALTRSSSREIWFANKEEPGMILDLHWGVMPEELPFRLEVGQLFAFARVEHHERISFLSGSPEHLLLLLCAHGSKHYWSNLRWLCDVACHVRSNPNLNWDLCIRLVEASGCELAVKHSLLLTRQVLGLELPKPIYLYASGDTKAHLLARKAQSFLFGEDEDRSLYPNDPPRYLEALRYRLALVDGSHWRNGAVVLFRRAFVPNEMDWRWLHLPRQFYFLYYLVRPLRLVIKLLSIRQFRLDGRRRGRERC